MARFEGEQSEYIEKVVATNRVSKTVKGGRVMKFSALMVVGDGKGKVGYGLGKAAEVPEAIRKGIEDAKKNMINVSLSGSTIPHEIIGEAGAGRVLMKPAAPGTGVIAGGPVRIIMEAAGIKDIRTKCLRSNTAVNVVAATFEGLKSLRTALMVVGDGKGKVGFGLGKAAEVPEAIRKGIEDAKKNMITVSLSGSTIPHEIIGEAGAGRVLMKPAAPGTGVIAGGPVRIIMEAAGIKDIRTKCLRSNTAVNVVAATFEGLKSLRTPEEVARTRGKNVDEIVG